MFCFVRNFYTFYFWYSGIGRNPCWLGVVLALRERKNERICGTDLVGLFNYTTPTSKLKTNGVRRMYPSCVLPKCFLPATNPKSLSLYKPFCIDFKHF